MFAFLGTKKEFAFEHDVEDLYVKEVVEKYNKTKYSIQKHQEILDYFYAKGYEIELRGKEGYALFHKKGVTRQRMVTIITLKR